MLNFKGLLCGGLVFALLSGTLIPAYAEDVKTSKSTSSADNSSILGKNAKITKESAKEIAKKFLKDYIDPSFDEKNYEIRISFSENSGSYRFGVRAAEDVWELQYQYNGNDTSTSIMISVDSETGKVTSYDKHYFSSLGQEQPKVAVFTEEQAEEIAQAFIEKVHPEIKGKIVKDSNNINKYTNYSGNALQYMFQYIRSENGVPFDSNGIIVGVDGITGNVSSLYFNWNENYSIPSAVPLIDKNKAQEVFNNETDMKLIYMIPYSYINNYIDTQSDKVKLVYTPDFKNSNLLDAQSGKMLKPSIFIDENPKSKDMSASEKEKFIKSIKAGEGSQQPLDESKTTELAKEIIDNLFGKDYELESINYGDTYSVNGKSRNVWSAQFRKKDSGSTYPQPGGNIAIDAATGLLVSINSHYYYDSPDTSEFTPKLSWDEAYDKAIALIEKYYPDKLSQIDTNQKYNKVTSVVNGVTVPERYYSFNFPRVVNGIPYDGNSISIGFDIKSGLIWNIHCNWDDDLLFPDQTKTISKDEARDLYLKSFTPALHYILVNTSTDSEKPDYEVKLVYILSSKEGNYASLQIDASSGESIDLLAGRNSRLLEFQKAISGHWGEKELGILASQGIIDMGTFKPDEDITKIDALKMLVNARGNYVYSNKSMEALKFTNVDIKDDSYRYLQLAVQYKLIENENIPFNLNEKVTREEMAELIVKLLKYDKIAKAKNIFTLPYSDSDEIDSELFGYVAVGNGLGYFVGDSGKFRPKDNTTMAEFAITVYKAIDLMK